VGERCLATPAARLWAKPIDLIFTIGKTPVNTKPGGNRDIVQEHEPFFVKFEIEDLVHHTLEIFWAVQRSKR
jgi:hypothetical protein